MKINFHFIDGVLRVESKGYSQRMWGMQELSYKDMGYYGFYVCYGVWHYDKQLQ